MLNIRLGCIIIRNKYVLISRCIFTLWGALWIFSLWVLCLSLFTKTKLIFVIWWSLLIQMQAPYSSQKCNSALQFTNSELQHITSAMISLEIYNYLENVAIIKAELHWIKTPSYTCTKYSYKCHRVVHKHWSESQITSIQWKPHPLISSTERWSVGGHHHLQHYYCNNVNIFAKKTKLSQGMLSVRE